MRVLESAVQKSTVVINLFIYFPTRNVSINIRKTFLLFYFILKFLSFLIIYHLSMKSVACISKWTRVNGQNTCLAEYFNMECTLVLILSDYSITQILMIRNMLCEINIVCIVYLVMTIYLNIMQLIAFN